eukprot:8333033-Lingulodinium_polyedra.AAC.1
MDHPCVEPLWQAAAVANVHHISYVPAVIDVMYHCVAADQYKDVSIARAAQESHVTDRAKTKRRLEAAPPAA